MIGGSSGCGLSPWIYSGIVGAYALCFESFGKSRPIPRASQTLRFHGHNLPQYIGKGRQLQALHAASYRLNAD
jgi:hypothetical protein